MIIYKITNLVNGKIYIGKTKRLLLARWEQHKRDCKAGVDYILYRAMRKHGIENFSIEQIDTATDPKELSKKEANYMVQFQSMSYQNGYNMRPEDNRGEISQVTRNKLSKSIRQAYNNNPLLRIQASQASTKKWDNEEQLQKQSQVSSKRWEDSEFKTKTTKAIKKSYAKSFNVYKATKTGKNNTYKIEKGDFVGTWENKSTCIKDLNIKANSRGSASGVGDNLHHRVKSAYGYIFEYIEK